MTKRVTSDFLAGVIEGFYGRPWSQAERFELFDWMAAWGLNTYLYAPKDDLKHRVLWREPYSAAEAASLGGLIHACNERNLRFIYALSPGLDIRYKDGAELVRLRGRFDQMLGLNCRNFALLFDDIPDELHAEDRKQFGSFATAQCHVANALFKWVRERSPAARFLFCPTPYCGRMAERHLGGEGYLETVGRELLPEIDVFWTGPEIISREITVGHVREVAGVLRRKPLIWDNLHANDYDGRRFFCGPYSGRSLELRDEVAGLLSNPNCEFPLNFVPLRTLGHFMNSSGCWDARFAFRSALREWAPRFATIGEPLCFDEIESFCDYHYLPYEDGEDAKRLFATVRELLSQPPAQWGERAVRARDHAVRLRDFCTRLAAMHDRPLFHALYRRVWELREELDLLERFLSFKSQPANAQAPFCSDSHLPGTYRGGLVARLQRLLVQRPDGSITPAPVNELAGQLNVTLP